MGEIREIEYQGRRSLLVAELISTLIPPTNKHQHALTFAHVHSPSMLELRCCPDHMS